MVSAWTPAAGDCQGREDWKDEIRSQRCEPAGQGSDDRTASHHSSQNHGYEVLRDTLPEGAEETFINVNDGTCEGITYHDMPAFTVQFHPEACAGPKDTEELFGRFIQMMRDYKEKEGASCR